MLAAADAIAGHVARLGLRDGLTFDAVRMRLIEIGEAVKALDPALLATEPDIAWGAIARMRDRVAHHYVDTAFAVIAETVERDVPALAAAVRRILARLDGD